MLIFSTNYSARNARFAIPNESLISQFGFRLFPLVLVRRSSGGAINAYDVEGDTMWHLTVCLVWHSYDSFACVVGRLLDDHLDMCVCTIIYTCVALILDLDYITRTHCDIRLCQSNDVSKVNWVYGYVSLVLCFSHQSTRSTVNAVFKNSFRPTKVC